MRPVLGLGIDIFLYTTGVDIEFFVFPIFFFSFFESVVRSSCDAFLVGRINPKHPGLLVSSLARLLSHRELPMLEVVHGTFFDG